MTGFRGILCAMATPFTSDGERVDEQRLKPLIDWLIAEGVHGIIPMGSTGEFASQEEAERKRVVELTIEHASGRVPVVVHTADISTRKVVMYSKHAEEAGAAGLMIVPPYYEPISEEEIFAHYQAVSDAVGIPIMVYNIPSAAGVDMGPQFVDRLAAIEHVEMLKDSTGNALTLQETIDLCGDRIDVFNGWDSLSFLGLVAGSVGCVWGAANVMPRQCVELYELVAEQGDLAAARELWRKMLPICFFLEREGYAAGVKAGAAIAGMDIGPPRRPILPLSPAKREELAKLLAPLGIGV